MNRSKLLLVVVISLLIVSPAISQEDNTVNQQIVYSGKANYIMGPGDQIGIMIFDKMSFDDPGNQYEAVIQEDGTIVVPVLGSIVAAGKTSNQLEADLMRSLKKFVSSPFVFKLFHRIRRRYVR